MATGSSNDAQDVLLKTLKVLSHPIRFRILQSLGRADSNVGELSDRLAISQPLMSYHLKVLRQAGLVRHRRNAQATYYSVNPETVSRLRALLDSLPSL